MMLSTLRRAPRAPAAHLSSPRAPAAHLSSLASMTPGGGVHGSQTSVNARRWRQKPLLRVYGEELYFKTGSDAVKLLSNEAERRDKDKPLYLDQFTNFMRHLQPVRISASRGVEAPSRHRRDSWPSHDDVGGFFVDFGAVRTEYAPRRSSTARRSTRGWPRFYWNPRERSPSRSRTSTTGATRGRIEAGGSSTLPH